MSLFTSLESCLSQARVGVVGSDSASALKACEKAEKKGIIKLVLLGDKVKTEKIIEEIGFDSPYSLHEATSYTDAAEQAVALAKLGMIDIILKGRADTTAVMRAIFNKEKGIPPKDLCSSVSIFEYENRFILISDPAINIYPSLENKAFIVQNAIDVARALGIKKPKVAVLSPTEIVQEKISETVHGEELSIMAKEGRFGEAYVYGMALDVALSKAAAQHKMINNEVAGEADILIAHDLNAANILHKCFSLFTKQAHGSIIVGSRVPVVLTSRSEDEETKLNSILLASNCAFQGTVFK